MQVIFKNKNEESYSIRADAVGIDICTRRIRGCMEKNIMKDLESGVLELKTVRKFLKVIRKEFEGEDEESRKMMELKKLEQGDKIIEAFVQEFRRVARRSGYIERPLVEEFKKEINREVR